MDIGEPSSDGYSDGETSEDLYIRSPSRGSSFNSSYGSFKPDSPIFQNNLTYFLSKIDPGHIKLYGQVNLASYTDQDFYIDQMNRPFLSLNALSIDPVQSVILVTSRPKKFPEIESEYYKNKPTIFAWVNLKTTPITDLPVAVQSFYKPQYLKLRPQISFHYFIGPSNDKIASTQQLRKECARGRQLFHYIGYGFPNLDVNGFSFCDSPTKMPFTKLFETIVPPSCFILDCNNAGVAIPYFIKSASRFIAPSNRQSEFPLSEDWFCFCATDVGETIPMNPHLPRDFLSTCLLSPVPLAILCHVLLYFKTSFPNDDFPMQQINDLLLFEDPAEQNRFSTMLLSFIDAIVSEYITLSNFKLLFRRERMISRLFQRFIIAQYLLAPYSVHPKSYPELPSMANHPLWAAWQAEIAKWITTNVAKRPLFGINFFQSAINSFDIVLKNNTEAPMHLIAIVCHAPFTGFEFADQAIQMIAEFASRSHTNRIALSKVVVFHSFFQHAVRRRITQDAHALLYLVVCLLDAEPEFTFDIRRDLDITPLLNALFDKSIEDRTRALIAAILSAILDTVKAVESFCTTADFFVKLSNELPTAEPVLDLWLLILVKRVFTAFPADPALFLQCGVHIQVAALCTHDSPEVRAAAVAALTAFAGDKDPTTAAILLFLVAPVYFDCFYMVRFELVQFFARFVDIQSNEYFDHTLDISFSSLNEFIVDIYQKRHVARDFASMALAAEEVASRYGIDRAKAIIRRIVSVLQNDPHPSVKLSAERITQTLDAGSMDFLEGDIDGIFNVSLKQLARSPCYQRPAPPASPGEVTTRRVEIPACSVQVLVHRKINDIPTHIAFEHRGYAMMLSTTSKIMVRLDEKLDPMARITCSDCRITAVRTADWNESTVAAAASEDGAVHLMVADRRECVASFRAANPLVPKTNQKIALARFDPWIATSTVDGGVMLWDAVTQKLRSEIHHIDHTITAMQFAAFDTNIIAAGYADGSARFFDMRSPFEGTVLSPQQTGAPVLSVGSTCYSPQTVEMITADGSILSWDYRAGRLLSGCSLETRLAACEIHRMFPLVVGVADTGPIVATTDGKVLCRLSDMRDCSVVATHPTLPVIACARKNGDILSFQLAISYNQ